MVYIVSVVTKIPRLGAKFERKSSIFLRGVLSPDNVITLQVPIVLKINFLLTISIDFKFKF